MNDIKVLGACKSYVNYLQWSHFNKLYILL